MKVVKKTKKTIILEDDRGYRFHVQRDLYETEDVTEQELIENGIPVSLSFDLILRDSVDFETLTVDLYKQNIHTKDDVLNNRAKVNNIIRKHISANTLIK